MGISDNLIKAIDELNQIANNIKKTKKLDCATENINSKTVRPMARMRTMGFSTQEQNDPQKIQTKISDILSDVLRE